LYLVATALSEVGPVKIKRGLFDCETAAYKGFEKTFGVQVSMCSFHVKKAVNRQVSINFNILEKVLFFYKCLDSIKRLFSGLLYRQKSSTSGQNARSAAVSFTRGLELLSTNDS
jgi:hypothetical protein